MCQVNIKRSVAFLKQENISLSLKNEKWIRIKKNLTKNYAQKYSQYILHIAIEAFIIVATILIIFHDEI